MTVPLNQSSGEIESAQGNYLDLSPEGSAVSVHMHLDAIDGIGRDVIEGFRATPLGGIEVGGLLLGSVEPGDSPSIRIERYQRIPCNHRSGPQFVLDPEDMAGLEDVAEALLKSGELSVVGLYRSHTRPGLQPEVADFELIGRYFRDPSDLMLLLKPESMIEISARFFRREPAAGVQPVGPAFPFRGRALTLNTVTGPAEATARQSVEAANLNPDLREHPRRLIPDFVPSTVIPSQTLRQETAPFTPAPATDTPGNNWWPLLAAILLVGGGAWFFLQPSARHLASNTAPKIATPAPDRPLGLYVDPASQTWHVSWNPNATALHDARSVQLFVREGDDQNRVDLSPADLSTGMYQYRPAGNDVTFRLEVTENSGRVSAESFRLTRPALPVAAPAPTPKAPSLTETHLLEPRATHRVPPVVPASIKPRIKGVIPIDVRVHIDTGGRVTAAAPVAKQPSGLHAYLANRAVEAARLWRFEPARENGKAVPGTETIHFVFEN
jgi:TonB family protein